MKSVNRPIYISVLYDACVQYHCDITVCHIHPLMFHDL